MSEDIISDLPRDAIDNILTCLSLRDAVRTSILSKSWRHKWTGLPHLIFDCDTFGETEKTHDRLLIALFEVVLRYRGKIEKFVLSLPGLKSCPQIDQLISFASKNFSFKDFTLHILEGDEPYKLPLSLFSWMEIDRLSLQHCVIEPPIWFKGFNKLVSLEISECSILANVLSGLISSCQLLEEVTVSSLTTVEDQVEISAPNLRKLSLTGDANVVETTSNLFMSLCNLPAVEDLELDYYYAGDKSVDSNNIPRKLTTTLNHLRSLTLWKISFCLLREVSTILCLIRSSPNLSKIVVEAFELTEEDASEGGFEHVINLLQVQEWEGVYLNNLREVEFNGIFGTMTELGFIELLLSISPRLETMIVTRDKSVELEDKLEIVTEVTLLPRSSPYSKSLLQILVCSYAILFVFFFLTKYVGEMYAGANGS